MLFRSKYKGDPNIITETGSKGGKIFLLKWGMTIKFFKKFIMQSDKSYSGQLENPKKNLYYFSSLLISKMHYLYVKYIYNYKNKHNLV